MENRRKQLHVPKEYQKRMVIVPILVIIIAINALIVIGLLLFEPVITTYLTPTRVAILAVFEFLVLAILYRLTRLMSHTLAGPIHALMCRLDKLSEGDLVSQIEFRKRDFHHALADCFNRNMDNLRQRIIRIKTLAHALEETGQGPDRSNLIEKIDEELSTLKTRKDESEDPPKGKEARRPTSPR
jgi:methyl-accepting chemotaxis protein